MSVRGKALAVLFLLAAVLGAAMVRVAPPRTLDRLPWYTAREAGELLADLGPDGRRRYAANERLDLGFLAVYSAFAFLATGLLWEGRLSGPAIRRARRLALVPGLFDLAETSLVLSALAGWPESLPAKLGWLCLLTPAKWLSAAVLAASALAGAALRFGRPGLSPPQPQRRNS